MNYEYLLNRLVQRIGTIPREEHVINEAPEGLKRLRYVREEWLLETISEVLNEEQIASFQTRFVVR